jgi:xylulokinase
MFIGIDLGTSSVKIIWLLEDGKILDELSIEYPVSYINENWAEQNPQDWWDKTFLGLKTIIDRNINLKDSIKSIGLSGQMHGMVAIDENGFVLTPAIIWCDQRTTVECNDITNNFGKEKLSELVGNMALTGFTAPKILWLKKNNPDVFYKTKMFLLPKDYINFKLTGFYCSDMSDASGMLLLDVKNRKYQKEMLDYLEIDESKLPKLYESYEVIGELQSYLKRELNLTQDIIVVAGAGDQAAGAIGSGTVNEGIISITLGTSGVVFAAHDKYLVDKDNRLHAFCHANGKYHSMGVMLSAASSLKWWAENVQNEEIEILLDEVNNDISDVIFLPYLLGERTPYPDPNVRGTIVGLSIGTNRKEITKAILEGVAFGLKDSLDILNDMNIKINEIRIIGGGVKSEKWIQIISDILGYELLGINTNQGGALGAAILASVGYGKFKDISLATETIISTNKIAEPNMEKHEIYNKKHKKYKKLYQELYSYYNEI